MADWSTEYISALLSECGAIAMSDYDKPGTEMKGVPLTPEQLFPHWRRDGGNDE